jgi:hypothetical protein
LGGTKRAHATGKVQQKAASGTSLRGATLHPAQEAEGESVMSVVLTDLLLFICLALFLTGIMIAGAILIS